MISERKALSLTIDGNDCLIAYEGEAPALGAAALLLDARGRLVGVDLGGEGFGRVVVMFGPHEAVASQRDARVSVEARGEEAGAIRVHGGKALVHY